MKGILNLIILLGAVFIASDMHAQQVSDIRPINGVGNEYRITAFAVDKDNNKYIGTNNGLLRVSVDGMVETLYSGGAVQAVVWHSREGVWIATDSNRIYNPQTGGQVFLEGDSVNITAMALSGSTIWAGTNNGIYTVSAKKQRQTNHYTRENSKLLSDKINDIFIDASRIKWVGTSAGVLRIEDKKWKVYEKEQNITALTGNSEGVWIAADNEMWLVDPFNRWTPTGATNDLIEGPLRALAADKKGNIYILSDILVQFDPYEDISAEIDNNYTLQPGEDVAILLDDDENLWVGSQEHGLVAMKVEPPEELALDAYITVEHPVCHDEASGILSVTPVGGTPPYSYSWSNTNVGHNSLGYLDSGKYTVTVTDRDDNQRILEAELINPDELTIRIQPDLSRGSARAIAEGGTGGYIYSWSTGAQGRDVSGLLAGVHSVTVTDNSGCTAESSYDQPPVEGVVGTAELTDASSLEAVDADVLKTIDVTTLAIGQTLRIEQLYFAADSTDVNPQSYTVLDEIYQFLANNDRIAIEVGGHTNGLPEHDYCDRLSTARAESVANYLYRKGIPENRIIYKGYGKRQPIATNATVAGRRKNQRVEIKILEI